MREWKRDKVGVAAKPGFHRARSGTFSAGELGKRGHASASAFPLLPCYMSLELSSLTVNPPSLSDRPAKMYYSPFFPGMIVCVASLNPKTISVRKADAVMLFDCG